MGYVELKVSDLAQQVEGEQSYASTGKKIGEDPIRLDKGTYKGKLLYEAEFVPAMHVKNVTFSKAPNAIERAVESSADTDGGTVSDSESSSDIDAQSVPVGVTIATAANGGHKKTTSTDTTSTVSTVNSKLTHNTTKSTKTADEARPEDDAPVVSKEELLTYRE